MNLIQKITVLKLGGSAFSLSNTVFQDIVFLKRLGAHPVFIHGGGQDITDALKRCGKKAVFAGGLRVTDRNTLRVVRQTLLKTNKKVCAKVRQFGGKSVSFPTTSHIFLTEKLRVSGNVDLGFVGHVKNVRKNALLRGMKKGMIPVISPLGRGKDGQIYNINADLAASALACSLSASYFFLLTDVDGVYKRKAKIQRISAAKAGQLKKRGFITKGMLPKVDAGVQAAVSGVPSVRILNGNIPHAVFHALLDEKMGTTVVK